MCRRFLRFLMVLGFTASFQAWSQNAEPQAPKNGGDFSNSTEPTVKVPKDVIVVKGAWASASDSTTPLPEGGGVSNNVFSNPYFGITYTLPQDWFEKFKGPPPSETGRYVLAQIRPSPTYKGPAKGNILITAEDMFFTTLPAKNALEYVNYTKDHLQSDYKLEMKPTEATIGGRPFTFFSYWSPVAELHWYVLATVIRCHTVQIVLTSRDTKLLESLVREMDRMKLPAETGPTAGSGGGPVPVCLKDYANDHTLINRVEPVFTEHKFNAIPVRIIINKEGKIKHTHFISAFPDQAKAITEALEQWRFKPYLKDGKPIEVETGIMFGQALLPAAPAARGQSTD